MVGTSQKGQYGDLTILWNRHVLTIEAEEGDLDYLYHNFVVSSFTLYPQIPGLACVASLPGYSYLGYVL